MRLLSALASGLLFGVGLALSGLMNPARVLGFLDITGRWDPTLVFVLGGAVAVSALGYAVSRRLAKPVFARRFEIPTAQTLDATLLLGAGIFGVGWGLVGFCPGPALASLSLGLPKSYVFVLAMLAGMILHGAYARMRRPAAA